MNLLIPQGWLSYTRYALRPVDEESKKALQSMGIKSIYPLDEYLGVDNLPFRVSCEMALTIAKKCICAESYESVAKELSEVHGPRPGSKGLDCLSDDTVRLITDFVGDIVLEAEDQFVEDMTIDYDPSKIKIGHRRGHPKADPYIVYLQTDGATYLARTEGTLEAGYHENKLGVIFTSDTMEERVDEKGYIRPKMGEREYVCNVDGVEAHRKHLLATALKYDLENADAMVIISDGAEWIKLMKQKYFPFAQQILDLMHAKENIYKFADQELKEDGTAWGTKACKMLENGQWRELLALPEVYQYSDKGGKELPKGRFNLYNYLWGFRDCIDYPTYIAKGYLIGSGAVESGHRGVMQARLKREGMRWLPSKAAGVLILRAKLRSGLWDIDVRKAVIKNYHKKAKVSP